MIGVGSILQVQAPVAIRERSSRIISLAEIPRGSLVLVVELDEFDPAEPWYQPMTFVTQFGSVVWIQGFNEDFFDEVRHEP